MPWPVIEKLRLRVRMSPIVVMMVLALMTACTKQDSADRVKEFDARAQWAVQAFDAPVLTQSQLAAMLESAR